jgi:lipopolysaccharide/colanic/teichoic acid biosynthesis glycosyltransferase
MRHAIKPGISGWAQVNFRPSASMEEAKEKLAYDLYYIKNRSLILDATILIKTLRHLF